MSSRVPCLHQLMNGRATYRRGAGAFPMAANFLSLLLFRCLGELARLIQGRNSLRGGKETHRCLDPHGKLSHHVLTFQLVVDISLELIHITGHWHVPGECFSEDRPRLIESWRQFGRQLAPHVPIVANQIRRKVHRTAVCGLRSTCNMNRRTRLSTLRSRGSISFSRTSPSKDVHRLSAT